MKKLSKVQLKQQAAVMAAVTALEDKALKELEDCHQAWFSMEHNAFPGSLLVRLQFNTQTALEAAEPQLLLWQKRLGAQLLKKGIVLKDMRKNLVFTLDGPED